MIRNEKSCGVILFRNQAESTGKEFLLLHYPGGHWDFPKGHVENNETEQETALRELEEETSITEVQLLTGFREPMNYSFRHQGVLIKKEVVFFIGITQHSAPIQISHEHHDFAWISEDETKNKLTYDNAKQLFQKAHQFLANKSF